MGRLLHELCNQQGIEVTGIIDPFAKEAHFKSITAEALQSADVWIDFTLPKTILENIALYQKYQAAVVIGTTGWYDKAEEVKEASLAAEHKFLYASNFSIGVNLYFAIVASASALMNKVDNYDTWAHELHHNNKADSPSGTAKTLSEILLDNLKSKDKAVFEMLDRRIEKNELHFASIRGGQNNFEHHITFGSDHDKITLSHSARDRNGYADGAVKAAVWLYDQTPGFYQLDDFIKSIIG